MALNVHNLPTLLIVGHSFHSRQAKCFRRGVKSGLPICASTPIPEPQPPCPLIPRKSKFVDFLFEKHCNRLKEFAFTFGNLGPIGPYESELESYILQLKALEKGRRDYHGRSPQLSQRRAVVEFMLKLCKDHKWHQNTFIHSVYLYDRFTDLHDVHESQLKLAALSCIVIAGKLEENDQQVPRMSKLWKYNPYNGQQTRQNFPKMEEYILKALDYRIFVPTEQVFLDAYLIFAMDGCNNHVNLQSEYSIILAKIHEAALYIVNKLTIKTVVRQKPSLTAAAILMFARSLFGITCWTQRLVFYTGYSCQEVSATLKWMIDPITMQEIKLKFSEQ